MNLRVSDLKDWLIDWLVSISVTPQAVSPSTAMAWSDVTTCFTCWRQANANAGHCKQKVTTLPPPPTAVTPNFPTPRNITLYFPPRITNFKNPFAVVSAGSGLGVGVYLLVFHPHPWIPTSWFLLLTTAHKDAPPLPGLHFPESRVSRPRPRRGNTTDFLVWVPNARTGYEAQIWDYWLFSCQREGGSAEEVKSSSITWYHSCLSEYTPVPQISVAFG